jgi:hypothetical protein
MIGSAGMLSALFLASAVGLPLGQDTVVLGEVERDLTGDGSAEVLRLVGKGASIDSLDVAFSIESSGVVIFETNLRPLTRVVRFDAGRRVLTSAEHQARVAEFGDRFFAEGKFMSAGEFLERLQDRAPGHARRIPEVIARDQRMQFVRDSLLNEGYSPSEARRRAPALIGLSLDATDSQIIWEEIQRAPVTLFEFSPGGDRIYVIAWSRRDRRFYDLLECC